MMLHSRSQITEKTKTDINKLISDYVELAYHGVRVKEPTFECRIEINLGQKNFPKYAIHQQNISRVILNLLGNAFYTVSKRSKLADNRTIHLSLGSAANWKQILSKLRLRQWRRDS